MGSYLIGLLARRTVSVTVNLEPFPSSLSTSMAPPIISTIFFVMAMPRPVPWMPLTVADCSRAKVSNTWPTNSGDMPMPVSLMENS